MQSRRNYTVPPLSNTGMFNTVVASQSPRKALPATSKGAKGRPGTARETQPAPLVSPPAQPRTASANVARTKRITTLKPSAVQQINPANSAAATTAGGNPGTPRSGEFEPSPATSGRKSPALAAETSPGGESTRTGTSTPTSTVNNASVVGMTVPLNGSGSPTSTASLAAMVQRANGDEMMEREVANFAAERKRAVATGYGRNARSRLIAKTMGDIQEAVHQFKLSTDLALGDITSSNAADSVRGREALINATDPNAHLSARELLGEVLENMSVRQQEWLLDEAMYDSPESGAEDALEACLLPSQVAAIVKKTKKEVRRSRKELAAAAKDNRKLRNQQYDREDNEGMKGSGRDLRSFSAFDDDGGKKKSVSGVFDAHDPSSSSDSSSDEADAPPHPEGGVDLSIPSIAVEKGPLRREDTVAPALTIEPVTPMTGQAEPPALGANLAGNVSDSSPPNLSASNRGGAPNSARKFTNIALTPRNVERIRRRTKITSGGATPESGPQAVIFSPNATPRTTQLHDKIGATSGGSDGEGNASAFKSKRKLFHGNDDDAMFASDTDSDDCMQEERMLWSELLDAQATAHHITGLTRPGDIPQYFKRSSDTAQQSIKIVFKAIRSLCKTMMVSLHNATDHYGKQQKQLRALQERVAELEAGGAVANARGASSRLGGSRSNNQSFLGGSTSMSQRIPTEALMSGSSMRGTSSIMSPNASQSVHHANAIGVSGPKKYVTESEAEFVVTVAWAERMSIARQLGRIDLDASKSLFKQFLTGTATRSGGRVVRDGEDGTTFMVSFTKPVEALAWERGLRKYMMYLPWPSAMLGLRECEEEAAEQEALDEIKKRTTDLSGRLASPAKQGRKLSEDEKDAQLAVAVSETIDKTFNSSVELAVSSAQEEYVAHRKRLLYGRAGSPVTSEDRHNTSGTTPPGGDGENGSFSARVGTDQAVEEAAAALRKASKGGGDELLNEDGDLADADKTVNLLGLKVPTPDSHSSSDSDSEPGYTKRRTPVDDPFDLSAPAAVSKATMLLLTQGSSTRDNFYENLELTAASLNAKGSEQQKPRLFSRRGPALKTAIHYGDPVREATRYRYGCNAFATVSSCMCALSDETTGCVLSKAMLDEVSPGLMQGLQGTRQQDKIPAILESARRFTEEFGGASASSAEMFNKAGEYGVAVGGALNLDGGPSSEPPVRTSIGQYGSALLVGRCHPETLTLLHCGESIVGFVQWRNVPSSKKTTPAKLLEELVSRARRASATMMPMAAPPARGSVASLGGSGTGFESQVPGLSIGRASRRSTSTGVGTSDNSPTRPTLIAPTPVRAKSPFRSSQSPVPQNTGVMSADLATLLGNSNNYDPNWWMRDLPSFSPHAATLGFRGEPTKDTCSRAINTDETLKTMAERDAASKRSGSFRYKKGMGRGGSQRMDSFRRRSSAGISGGAASPTFGAATPSVSNFARQERSGTFGDGALLGVPSGQFQADSTPATPNTISITAPASGGRGRGSRRGSATRRLSSSHNSAGSAGAAAGEAGGRRRSSLTGSLVDPSKYRPVVDTSDRGIQAIDAFDEEAEGMTNWALQSARLMCQWAEGQCDENYVLDKLYSWMKLQHDVDADGDKLPPQWTDAAARFDTVVESRKGVFFGEDVSVLRAAVAGHFVAVKDAFSELQTLRTTQRRRVSGFTAFTSPGESPSNNSLIPNMTNFPHDNLHAPNADGPRRRSTGGPRNAKRSSIMRVALDGLIGGDTPPDASMPAPVQPFKQSNLGLPNSTAEGGSSSGKQSRLSNPLAPPIALHQPTPPMPMMTAPGASHSLENTFAFTIAGESTSTREGLLQPQQPSTRSGSTSGRESHRASATQFNPAPF